MSSPEEELDPYELLSLKQDATEQEIKTAYRQRSLKVHPDRNPNNPDAARKFHELNQAYELLLDPLRRLALDAKLKIKHARAERFKSYDSKRKNLVEELEERERAFKKARTGKQKEEAETRQANERIKEEGKRLREEKERGLRKMQETEMQQQVHTDTLDVDAPPSTDALDMTVRIRYPLKTYPTLSTPQSISAFLSRFGATDKSSIVLSTTLKEKTGVKPPKMASALVPFKRIGDAFAAVCASEKKDMGMAGVKVNWVKGEEPAILGWLRKIGKLSNAPSTNAFAKNFSSSLPPKSPQSGGQERAELPQNQTGNSFDPFSSFPSTLPDNLQKGTSFPTQDVTPEIDYESLTLMRLRQAERERLEREILDQEAREA